MFRYLPEQASTIAPDVDWLHHIITDLSVFFTIAVCGSMLYFAIRYRKRDGVDHETPRIEGNHILELIWTVVPTLICVFVAYYGIAIYRDMHDAGDNPLIVNVVGKQWLWEFEYENGKKTINEFVVPVNKPIKIVLTSKDVLHSFFLPAMRVKRDVIPGQYTSLVFHPVKVGEYVTFCTEYCGTQHSAMLANLRVVSEAEYDRWVNDRSADIARLAMSPAKLGSKLYSDKGCNACHSLDGSRLVGPSLLKLYDSEKKDEEYLRESILYPNKVIAEGYPSGLMPAFEGQLSDDELKGLIAFIREQDGSKPLPEPSDSSDSDAAAEKLAAMSPEERGEYIYKNKACIGCHSLDGSNLVGPTFKGVYGKKGKLQGGAEYEANDQYIKRSILEPNADVVEGYAPAMPPYAGQLSDEDIAGVIAFLKTVK